MAFQSCMVYAMVRVVRSRAYTPLPQIKEVLSSIVFFPQELCISNKHILMCMTGLILCGLRIILIVSLFGIHCSMSLHDGKNRKL